MGDWPKEGDKAPLFTLETDEGSKWKLSDAKGKPVVIYFYPKDDTPGCTKEACAFRDQKQKFKKRGVELVGISPDSQEDHEKFRDKYKLNFPLLVDSSHKVAERYGAWREKNMYGRKKMGIVRSTFLIDASGRFAKIWRRVQVDGHDDAVLEAIAELAV